MLGLRRSFTEVSEYVCSLCSRINPKVLSLLHGPGLFILCIVARHSSAPLKLHTLARGLDGRDRGGRCAIVAQPQLPSARRVAASMEPALPIRLHAPPRRCATMSA